MTVQLVQYYALLRGCHCGTLETLPGNGGGSLIKYVTGDLFLALSVILRNLVYLA